MKQLKKTKKVRPNEKALQQWIEEHPPVTNARPLLDEEYQEYLKKSDEKKYSSIDKW